jgi:[ribosomal protein S18]-alanine N-acetyltransferase
MSTTQEAANSIATGFSLSRMTEHDLLDVVEIEEHSGLSRWGWGAYYAELQSANRNYMFVARRPEGQVASAPAVAGYIVARLVAGELHINNVAVRDAYRRCGIGSMLLTRVIDEARAQGAKVAFLEVRVGNVAAQALYQKCGFRPIARRNNYYSAPLEDALVMRLNV